MAILKLKLAGLTCDMCISSVTNIVKSVDAVDDVKVDLTSAEVQLNVEPNDVLIKEIITEIVDIGYEAELAT